MRLAVALTTLLVGCPSPSVPADASPPLDVPRPDDAVSSADASGDAAVSDTPRLPDAPGPSVTTWCERLAMCGSTSPTCAADFERELTRARTLGCSAQADAANACTLRIYEASCSPTRTQFSPCDDPYRAFNQCVIAATGVHSFSCQLGATVCLRYEESGNDPATACGSTATPVESCPTPNAVARCSQPQFGGVTTVTTYYAPIMPEPLRASCESNGGTFTVL